MTKTKETTWPNHLGPCIEHFNQEIKLAWDALRESGQADVEKSFKELFLKHPEILAIKWEQYTPYFMDGDPCEFSLESVEFKLDHAKLGLQEDVLTRIIHALYRNEFTSSWNFGSNFVDGEKHPLHEILNQIDSDIHQAEDAMEMFYGDHVQIVVTPEGVKTSEYDHD